MKLTEYKDINKSEIDLLKDLWYKNLEYHYENEKHFKNQYKNLSFEKRMESIFENAEKIKITIVVENETPVGYCISKIGNNEGEVMSLHVLETKRGSGIGKKLTQLHLDWLKENNCSVIGLYAASENYKTIKFYEQFGLKVNMVYMQIPDQEN